jgi:hypothetical protein
MSRAKYALQSFCVIAAIILLIGFATTTGDFLVYLLREISK